MFPSTPRSSTCFFSSGFQTESLYPLLYSSMHATLRTHRNILDLITLLMLVAAMKFRKYQHWHQNCLCIRKTKVDVLSTGSTLSSWLLFNCYQNLSFNTVFKRYRY